MTHLLVKADRPLERFLDEDCLLSKGEIYQKDLQITFKYDFIAPDPQVPKAFFCYVVFPFM